MKPEKDNSPYVPQRDKVKKSFEIKTNFTWTEKQKKFLEIAQNKNTRVMIVKGCAGVSKTYISVYCALQQLLDKKVSEILYIRNPVESSNFQLGYLAGSLEDKLTPYKRPLEDKLKEFLNKKDVENLFKEDRIKTIPVGFLRGLSFNATFMLADEVQAFETKDILLLMSRLGKFSKLFLIGDFQQPDIRNSGFESVYNLFNNEESKSLGIHTFEFNKDDIVRDELLKFIIGKFEELKKNTK